ncbi:NAD(P)-dependent alcohol dehydrogenase [Neisseria sp. Ec49-e6-T10]|uniref:NAD(P)-dependent alcohol dehydrogenase n=1 Tax=Neisseria sp. Ec49-e6-T10 TaxID=3140744 RepID=UPI003EBC2324
MRAKAAVTLKNQQGFEIKEIEIDEPKANEVLIRVVATGVCHTDAVARDLEGLVEMPAILGHEGSGVIEKIGTDVQNVKVGDYVVMSFASCHHCENCLTAHPSACESFNLLNFDGRTLDGSTPYHYEGKDLSIFFGQSSFSQYVVTKADNVIPVDVDNEEDLSLLGPLGCGIQTGAGTVINHLNPKAGESIVIFGTGAVGLSAIMAAKLTGCAHIIAVDIHEHRLELAKKLGATHTINGKMTNTVEEVRKITKKGAHYAIETTGVAPIVLQAVHSIKPLGTVVIVGFTGEVTFNIQNDLMAEGKTMVGVIEGDSVPPLFIPKLVELYKQGKFPIDQLVAFYSLDQINQAFNDSSSGKVIKPIIKM